MPKSKKRKPSDCRQQKGGKQCQGKYRLTYDDGAPIFTCDQCGDQDLTWKKFYSDYLQLFKVKENWDDKKNQVSCIIGFFLYSYEKRFNTKYVFIPKSPNPFSSKECRDAWALLAAFSGDAHGTRKYMHWLFNKQLGHSASIVSFGYLTTPGLIRKYQLYAANKNTLTRASALPGSFVLWCKQNVPQVFDQYELNTMNDLGALANYYGEYYKNDPNKDNPLSLIISEAEKLKLVINGKLNVDR